MGILTRTFPILAMTPCLTIRVIPTLVKTSCLVIRTTCPNQVVTEKLTRGVKTPINNLIRAKIKIDRGRSDLTWFETGAYTKTTLMKLNVNHMQL